MGGEEEGRRRRECAGREKPLVVSESVEPRGLRCVAPARLANVAPKVGGRLEQPQCHRQRENSVFLLLWPPQDLQNICKVEDLCSCAAEPA